MPVGAEVVDATTIVWPSGVKAICELVDILNPLCSDEIRVTWATFETTSHL